MRIANVLFHGEKVGMLTEVHRGQSYAYQYDTNYNGPAVSVSLPVAGKIFSFSKFPPFFDGLLPEGIMLDSLLKSKKIDREDYWGQLVVVGGDLVGAVTVEDADAVPDNI